MKAILLAPITIFFILSGSANAQDKLNIQWGKIDQKDFTIPKSPAIDSNANAIIIADVGNTSFVGNTKGWFSYIFKRKTRIMILNKKGFDAADVGVYLYGEGKWETSFEDVSGTTYNLENGKVISTKLDKRQVFSEQVSKNYSERKFTMPAVKEGSVIEYSYTIKSDFDETMHEWQFQDPQYPCLWSEYEVKIPATLIYVFIKQGYHDFLLDQSSTGHQNMTVSEKLSDEGAFTAQTRDLNVSMVINNHRWAMKDIPALSLPNEKYISSPSNYIDKIEFQLSQIYDGQEIHDRSNSWKQATSELLANPDFGQPIRLDKEWLDKDLGQICGSSTSQLEQAKKIYYFLNSNFTCNNYNYWFASAPLDKTFKKKAGCVGDINLLLIAMLRERGLNADPVILSTREYGKNYSKYPVYSKLNYVVCRSVIEGKAYFLDAADPSLAFGILSYDCYNGHARIISEKDSASIYLIADSLKEKSITNVIIINDDKGKPSGGFQASPGQQESYSIRRKVRKRGQNEFFKSIQTSFGSDYTIGNTGIDSLNNLEEPLVYHYDFDFNAWNGQDILYFNPMLSEQIEQNPFVSSERKYPVEMYYAIDNLYTLSMEIPKGYSVDELPPSVRAKLPGNDGSFEYIIQKTDSDIQLKCHLKLNKATFSSGEYNNLRDFFAFIVKKESEQVVFKKSK